MPQPGDILYYQGYQFEDGSRKDKLFVILNRANINTPCLVLKTTSQSRRYPNVKRGCNPANKVFFVPKDWARCFELDTYIQLPPITEFSTKELLEGMFSKTMRLVNSLPSDCFAQLKNCLKEFRQDISQRHWELIF